MLNVTEVPGVTQVQPEEVDPFLAILMSRMFLEYHLTQQGVTSGHTTEQYKCRRQLAALELQHTVIIVQGKFMRRTGHAEEVFECHKLTTTIGTAAKCHRNIPIHGPIPFTDDNNRILKSASPVVPCVREFPMRVEGLE